jgi:hypothetical protein
MTSDIRRQTVERSLPCTYQVPCTFVGCSQQKRHHTGATSRGGPHEHRPPILRTSQVNKYLAIRKDIKVVRLQTRCRASKQHILSTHSPGLVHTRPPLPPSAAASPLRDPAWLQV